MVDQVQVQRERRATAPYNFVPLPKKVITVLSQEELLSKEGEALAKARLPAHNRFVEGRLSGYFTIKLTTLSPLFIRGGLSTKKPAPDGESEFERADREKGASGGNFRDKIKNKPDFFSVDAQGNPLIPGSSLRGMLRTLVEVITWSKVTGVTNKRLFFRTVEGANQGGGATASGSAVGEYYRKRMVNVPAGELGVQPGFWHTGRNGSYYEIEPCSAGRVLLDEVQRAFGLTSRDGLYDNGARNPNSHPRWELQYRQVWARIEGVADHLYYRVTELSTEERAGFQKGTLVLTGPMQNKKHAFVFFHNDPASPPFTVERRLMKEFMSEDQLTRWQREAFPGGDVRKRRRAGEIADNEPVFYLFEKGRLSFFGRAYMFRLPYEKTALDHVPPRLRRPWDVDYAEALFGFVRTGADLRAEPQLKQKFEQGMSPRAYAGRVQVSDAVLLNGSHPVWVEDPSRYGRPLVPKILGSPQPSSFQSYLVQTRDEKQLLAHYGSSSEDTEIRGFKFYWRRGPITAREIIENDDYWIDPHTHEVRANSTQHTQMRPLDAGCSFQFHLHFQNLNKVELGALAWALTLPGEPGTQTCHSLGMGKPFGMGAVHLEPTLTLITRADRYQTLFADGGWALAAEESVNLDGYISLFEKAMLGALDETGKSHLREVERIQMLLAMLRWDVHPPVDQLAYVNFRESNQRRVLPTPLDVLAGAPPSNFNTAHAPAPVAAPPPTENGDVLYLKPIEIQPNGDVVLHSNKFDERTTALIPHDRLGGRQIRVGQKDKVKCRVVEKRKLKNETILICEPAD